MVATLRCFYVYTLLWELHHWGSSQSDLLHHFDLAVSQSIWLTISSDGSTSRDGAHNTKTHTLSSWNARHWRPSLPQFRKRRLSWSGRNLKLSAIFTTSVPGHVYVCAWIHQCTLVFARPRHSTVCRIDEVLCSLVDPGLTRSCYNLARSKQNGGDFTLLLRVHLTMGATPLGVQSIGPPSPFRSCCQPKHMADDLVRRLNKPWWCTQY